MDRPKSKRIAGQSGSSAVDKVFDNFDLLAKILNLLPPKQVFSSKAVSNHWLALISDPLFLFTYTCLHRTILNPYSLPSQFYCNSGLLSLDGSDEIVPKTIRFKGVPLHAPNYSYLTLVNSSNGLMLYKYTLHTWFIVFNPTTNKHRLLPKLYCNYNWLENTVLAFDPLKSFDYKVVGFKCLPFDGTCLGYNSYYDRLSDECMIVIFSSKSGLWKHICLPAPSVGITMSKRVFWNGGIHWICKPNFHVRFDVNKEIFTWNQIPTDPNTFPEYGRIRYMGGCDSGLLLIKFPSFENYVNVDLICNFTILEMKKDSDDWVPKHHVNRRLLLPQIVLSDVTRSDEYDVLYVFSEADKDCFSMVIGIHGTTILYSINNRNNHIATKELKDCQKADYVKFFPFIPCLAPV